MSRRQSRPSADQDPQGSDESTSSGADEVAVIICAYTEERWDDIVEAIDSVAAQTVAATQTVLVVDHNDALMARAQEQFGESITIVANRHKQGLSGARNTGIESSSAPIIAFLDDDAVAEPTWLETMVACYAEANVMGVGGKVNPIWLTARPRWWPDEFDWVVGCSYRGLPTGRGEVRNPIGANMSVRRSAFAAVGGFSPAIGRVGKHPVGCEETELFIRIRQHWPEATVIYEPASAVGHKVPGVRASYKYFRARCFAEGLSKAVVAKLVGAQDGLSSERDYSTKTLPMGFLRGLKSGLMGDPNGFGKAGAIVSGLTLTVLGYLRGRLAKGPERNLSEIPQSSEAA